MSSHHARLGESSALELRLVHAVAGSAIEPAVVEQLIDAAQRPSPSPIDELTPREREVLALMARGKSNRAIADDLTLTKRAVEKHVGSIFMKLMLEDAEIVSRRVAAVLLYLDSTSNPDVAEPFLTVAHIS